MKTENSVSKNWDDLVFENRNQQYGAYVLRKSYSDNVLSGAFCSVSIGALILLIPFLSSFLRGEDGSIVPDPPSIGDVITPFIQPPTIEVIPPAPQTAVVPAVNINLPPQVVTDDPEVDIPTNLEVTASLTGDSNTDGVVPTTVSGVIPAEPPAIVEPSVFNFVEVMPVYDGGMEAMYKFIQRKIRYPGVAERNGLQGTVYVGFVINASGKVVDVEIVRGISADLDREAARVISMMPGWKAGKQHDKNVSVRMTLPIKFQLNNL